jgi:hypothetical protein
MPNTPGGYYEIPTERITNPSSPSIVDPAEDSNGVLQPGGGTEIATEYPIDVSDLPFIPFELP